MAVLDEWAIKRIYKDGREPSFYFYAGGEKIQNKEAAVKAVQKLNHSQNHHSRYMVVTRTVIVEDNWREVLDDDTFDD